MPAIHVTVQPPHDSRTRCSKGSHRCTELLLAASGDVLAITPQAIETLARVERITLLFERLDVQHCLLAERGVVRYPDYAIQRSQAAFATREELVRYEAALEVRCAATSEF